MCDCQSFEKHCVFLHIVIMSITSGNTASSSPHSSKQYGYNVVADGKLIFFRLIQQLNALSDIKVTESNIAVVKFVQFWNA